MSAYSAEIAANRFGMGAKEGELPLVKNQPQEWLLQQIKPLTFDRNLTESNTALNKIAQYRLAKKETKKETANNNISPQKKTITTTAANNLRKAANRYALQLTSDTLSSHIESDNSFQAHLIDFFSNHFSVSTNNLRMRLLAPTLEREAIAPNLAGQFADMLIAVEQHPAMLIYLNNEQSIGSDSKVGLKRKQRGLNENLAREILELHTLGVNGGYHQNDVNQLAMAISGWTVSMKPNSTGFIFRTATHQPGARSIMHKRYSEAGLSQGEAVLRYLAVHPATAKHISFKLARHFVADEPSSAIVDAMAQRWLATEGNLHAVVSAMVKHPDSWTSPARKLKTPREFLISTCRACGIEMMTPKKIMDSLFIMGQAPFSAGSPAGFGDTVATWGGSKALISRIEWTHQYAAQVKTPAIEIARYALGSHLRKSTEQIIMRAESRQQSLALLLMSPEFQRR